MAALAIGSLTSLPLALTCLGGSLLLIMSGILRMDEVYQVLEWRVLLFIGAILSLGKGMASSGADQYLAGKLSDFFVGMDPIYALIFFFILTIVMTSLLSNQATAVVMIPVAISTAGALGLSPMPFVMAVTIGASCCFVTPFEPAFMLVYGPGEYKFSDFFRLGILLNIVAAAVAIAIIPLYWGFVPLP